MNSTYSSIVPTKADGGPADHLMEMLRVMYPPVVLVHVGAGSGADLPRYAAWQLSSVTLIDADPAQAERLAAAAAERLGWTVRQILIDQEDGEGKFFVASNWRESSLLPAESLKFIWRNLSARECRSAPCHRLDTLFDGASGATQPNWLVVDCFPAARILSGAQQVLGSCDVVSVRVALGEAGRQGLGLMLADTDALLSVAGFVRVAVEEERSVVVGRAIYIRNYKAILLVARQQLQHESLANHDLMIRHKSQVESIASLEGRLADLNAARESSLQVERAVREQLESLAREHTLVTQTLADREAQQAAASADWDARTTALQSEVERVGAECVAWRERYEALGQDLERAAAENVRKDQLQVELSGSIKKEVLASESLRADCQSLVEQLNAALKATADEKSIWDIEKAGLVAERSRSIDELEERIQVQLEVVEMYDKELAAKTCRIIDLEAALELGTSPISGGHVDSSDTDEGALAGSSSIHGGGNPGDATKRTRMQALQLALERAEAQVDLMSRLLFGSERSGVDEYAKK